MKSKKLRTLSAVLVIAAITLGFMFSVSIGTLSAPGFQSISLLCPLGALTTMIASKLMVPQAIVSLAIVAVLIVLLGRAFCGWVCPIPLIQRLRHAFKKKGVEEKPTRKPHEQRTCGHSCATCEKRRGETLDSRHLILGGALLSTAVFGFPVFCLVCPIGLFFGLIALVVNLFAFGDVTWSLVIIPIILALELLAFRKWCHMICPLGAIMSLLGKANKTFQPTVDLGKCLENDEDKKCGACGRACDEGIDPRHPELSAASACECTKCRACIDACPTNAITMPLLPKKK